MSKLIGKTIGSVKILAVTGRRVTEYKGATRLRPEILVQCVCGARYRTTHGALLRCKHPSCVSCKKDRRRLVKRGDVFDQLTVIGFVSGRKGRNGLDTAVCLCACGNTKNVRNSSLSKNQTNSCGCKPKGSWKGAGDVSGTFMQRITRNATVRKLEMRVTATFLWQLFRGQQGKCALSGVPITLVRNAARKLGTASVDRIDSRIGYTPGNVQWVHKDINLMKMHLQEERFVRMCQAVAKVAKKKLTKQQARR